MGVKARQKPRRLAEKLLQIRTTLGLSQNEMIRLLDVELTQNRISEYELGNGEPSLLVLLQYARVTGVHMEALVDDELDLPEKLPASTNHEEIKRKYTSRRKKP
ncbi:MAG TPA: helix-turn-helix transcriptional regulator [Pyrinomonadaceae bacterium]|jgi:transcriptional regulator with XRE-family HTH domain